MYFILNTAELLDKLSSHPLYNSDQNFCGEWEFEFHEFDDSWKEPLAWILENVTDEFSIAFYDYYYIFSFKSESDAAHYKLVWVGDSDK